MKNQQRQQVIIEVKFTTCAFVGFTNGKLQGEEKKNEDSK